MNDKIENIQKWIEKADHDLGTAEITFIFLPQYYDTIAFHCQQATEKFLKAYLIFLEIPFRKSHALVYLLSLINQEIKISNDFFDEVSILEDFSVEIRYPDSTIALTNDELKVAISITKKVRAFIIEKIGLEIEYIDLI